MAKAKKTADQWIADLAKILAKIRDQYADQFARLFHVRLKDYWDGRYGLDIAKFDVEVVKSKSHEAMIDVVQAKYGDEAVRCVEDMMKAESKAI